MLEKQIGSKLNYVEAQAARVRIEQSFQDAGNRLIEIQHDLQSKEAEREAFVNDWRNRSLESLVQRPQRGVQNRRGHRQGLAGQ